MFDWNDEEVANIIWGEPGESDDHIVPYTEASDDYSDKKEWIQEAAANRPTDQKTSGTRRKLDGRYNLEAKEGISGSGFAMDSWVDLSSFKAAKTGRNSMGTDVLNKLTEINQFGSSRAQAGQFEKDAEMYNSTQETKEHGEFVDYGWDNIGSFDDFDRLFSNDDQLFGHICLGDSDELWSSSKDDLQRENEVADNLKFPGDRSSHATEKQADSKLWGKTPAATSQLTSANVLTNNEISDKAHKQKIMFKARRTGQDFCGNWSSTIHTPDKFETSLASMSRKSSPSSNITQQRQVQAPQSLQYHYMSNVFLPHTAFGTLGNPYPSMPALSQIQTGELQYQSLLGGYEISPGHVGRTNKPVDCPASIMTPQEKIEKLRRRQQIQAMLAIEKQHQQIRNFEKFDHDAENISTLPAPDSNSPLEHNDSSAVFLARDDYFVEDKILYRLQDIISKLDIKTRLCMRDSLFRLTQSAIQKHYGSNTSSTNKSSRDEHEVGSSGEINSHSWYAEMPDVETETNPIDRTVAHLLFHMPIFANLTHENKATGVVNSSDEGCLAEISNDKPFISHNSCPSAAPQNLDDYRSN